VIARGADADQPDPIVVDFIEAARESDGVLDAAGSTVYWER